MERDKIQNLIIVIAAAITCVAYNLLQEEGIIIRKLVILIFLVGLLILCLVYLTIDPLKSRVNTLEVKSFGLLCEILDKVKIMIENKRNSDCQSESSEEANVPPRRWTS